MKLLLVGDEGGTHVGESFRRAAAALGHHLAYSSTARAFAGPAALRALSWRFLGRRPPRLGLFSKEVLRTATQFRPHLLLATGNAPLTADTVKSIRALGTTTANYLTDDPWNPAFHGEWLMRSIAAYDVVFSPRRANLEDLRALGPRVEYLPFAYDPELFFPEPAADKKYDIIFAAGADPDRVPFIAALLGSGVRVGLFGGYWSRYPETRGYDGGLLSPAELRRAVAASHVALNLVRRANRDGHTMRTFESAAMRACMLVEDTDEHHEILGETAAYFDTPQQAVDGLKLLLRSATMRETYAATAHARVTGGPNTYRDRLITILQQCGLRADSS